MLAEISLRRCGGDQRDDRQCAADAGGTIPPEAALKPAGHPRYVGTGIAILGIVPASVRRLGIGHALIEDLTALGNSRGWSRLYWHADGGNAKARRLNDSFVATDKFLRYRTSLK